MTFGPPERERLRLSGGAERRIASRQKAFAEVWADPGGTALALPCKVLDISKTGAKLSALPESPLPDEFILNTAGVKYNAHVVWRRQLQVGVEFDTP